MQRSASLFRLCWSALLYAGTLNLSAVHAANIVTARDSTTGLTVVQIEGEFDEDDVSRFASATSGLSEAVVILRSPGGVLDTGIEIGRRIRMRGFTTYIPEGSLCASSCALAWLGGTKRLVGPDALVGFHAAYVIEGDSAREQGYANALIGSYLNDLGLGPEAIFLVTFKRPDDMFWLSPDYADQAGINAEFNFRDFTDGLVDVENFVDSQTPPNDGRHKIPDSSEFSLLSPNSISGQRFTEAQEIAREQDSIPSSSIFQCDGVTFFQYGQFSSYENISISMSVVDKLMYIMNVGRDYATAAQIVSVSDEWIYIRDVHNNVSGGLNFKTGELKLLERDRLGNAEFEISGTCL